tara:strand:- start:4822 stop:5226 length:405 start_codon:yes stop_codon:yes gene_type:complete
MKVNVTIELNVQDVMDLLCTAFEGGVSYWCESVRGVGGDTSTLPEGRTKIQYEYEWLAIGGDLELGADGEIHTLTPEGFEKGLQEWIDRNSAQVILITRIDGARRDTALDLGNIDAGDADNIIQYGLFGKLVYC